MSLPLDVTTSIDSSTLKPSTTSSNYGIFVIPCSVIPVYHQAIAALYFVLVIGLGIVGNGLLLVVFISNPRLNKKSMNLLICSNTVVNFVISAVIVPILASRTFLECPERYHVLIESANYFMQLCAVSSIFTLTTVAANRYLLIAHPHTKYRVWCTGRWAMCKVMSGIWVMAFIVVWLLWFVTHWEAYQLPGDGADESRARSVLEIIFILPSVLNYIPMVAIPSFHFFTIKTIRASRRRVLPAQTLNNVNSVEMSVSRPPARQPIRPLPQAWQRNPPSSGPGVGEQAPIRTIYGNFVNQPNSPRPVVQHNPQPNGHMFGRAETRMIRMMMMMYVLLAISWSPSLLYFIVHGQDKLNLRYYLYLFGFIIPIYPSLIPYVVLWSNKNLRNILRKKLFALRIYLRSR